MNWTANQIPYRVPRNADLSPCAVAVFYENTTSRNQAGNLCHRLTREFHEHLPLIVSWWKFNRLNDSALAQSAIQAASHADIILVATTSEHQLPKTVSDLIAHCAFLRTKPDGLLLAITQEMETDRARTTDVHPLVAQLKALARNAELDFLPATRLESAHSHEEIMDRIEHQAYDTTETLRQTMSSHDRPTGVARFQWED